MLALALDLCARPPAGGAAGPPPALVFDAQSQGVVANGQTVTVSHVVGVTSGYGLLRVTVAFLDPLAGVPAISTVTYNGVAMSLLTGSFKATTSLGFIATYYLVNPPSGTHNIVVTLDTNCNVVVCGDSWDGVKQATPFGTPAVANGNGTTVTVGPVTVGAGNFLLAGVIVSGTTAATSATPSGNLSALGNTIAGASPARTRGAAAVNSTNTGSITAGWLLNATKDWAANCVELKAA